MASTYARFAFLALASLSTFSFAAPATSDLTVRSTPGNKHVIVQLFEWNWDSVAQECRDYLGPNGFGYVQGDTANEHIPGWQWWTDYQVVSYQIVSKRGNRGQFQNMVNTCRSAGVGVIVDIVWNHMAGQDGPSNGIAGTGYTHYSYNGVYDGNDFHHCGTNGDDIQDWSNAWQVQNCELSNLADLKTESEKVRGKLVDYTNDLISLGVAGFRVDASKHVPPADQQVIKSRLSKQGLYFTHEVVDEGGPGVQSSDYLGLGDVQEFRYCTLMRDAFSGGNIAQLKDVKSRGWLPTKSANVFVVNHDRERGGGYLTYKSPNKQFELASIFSLAYPYGTPTVFSGYSFDNGDDGAPNGYYGTCSANGGLNGWQCQHRWTSISGMVSFFNTVGGAGLSSWKQGNNNQIAFARKNAGFVIINNDGSTWKSTFTTTLADGKYCDVITGRKNGSSCTGKTVTVKSGKLSNFSVGGHSAVAIHKGAKI